MDYLIFGLNRILPLLIIILLGIYLAKRQIINGSVTEALTTIVFNFALPAKLFIDTANSDFTKHFNLEFVLLSFGGTLISFLILTGLVLFFVKDLAKASAMIHGGYRGNFIYIGLPLIQSILGKEIVPAVTLIVVFVIPLYNILAVILLTVANSKNGKIEIKKIIKDILTNPLIVAVLVALPFSLFHIDIAEFIKISFASIGSIATPVSLLLIGASLKLSVLKGEMGKVLPTALYKVALQPLIIMPLVLNMNFSQDEIVTLFILFSVPPANNVYIVTKRLGGDAELASGITVMGLLLCVITLPIGITLLGYAGVI